MVKRGYSTVARQPVVPREPNESRESNEERWRAQVAAGFLDLRQEIEAINVRLQEIVARLDDGGVP